MMCGGVHGDDALEVCKELNEAVEEVIEIYKENRTPLPIPKEVVFETA